jgi:hypothetical protein
MDGIPIEVAIMIVQSIYEEVRAFLVHAWNVFWSRLRGEGASPETVRPVFAGLWQDSGNTYSVILAQASSLSLKYRRVFLSEVKKLVDPARAAELATAENSSAARNKEVRVPSDRSVHMFLRSPDFVVVGFEDGEALVLQRKQSLRYDEYLRARNPQPMLAFISPGVHEPTDENAQKLRRFVPVDDGRLIGWADECLIDWLGSAELRLGQASELVGRCFAGSHASAVRLDLASGSVEAISASQDSKSRDSARSLASQS